jgi:hypothetical protein
MIKFLKIGGNDGIRTFRSECSAAAGTTPSQDPASPQMSLLDLLNNLKAIYYGEDEVMVHIINRFRSWTTEVQGVREVSEKSMTNAPPQILISARTQEIPFFHMGTRNFFFEGSMT